METYREFLDRINSFEKKRINFGDGDFKGNPSIANKVDGNNSFARFYGDTVVFALDDGTKEKLGEYVDTLYHAAPECFCERLVPNTFHVTLHDLSNSVALHEVKEEMFYNELAVIDRIGEIQRLKPVRIGMKSNYVFNMVNTSLVLGLYPADEQNYNEIMKLYAIFDGVKKLNYPFTPHVTLAYYNVNGFSARSAAALAETVNRLNDEIELHITLEHLFYQKFKSMNDYTDVVKLTK